MNTETDILKRVRKIEIRAKGLSRQLFSGEYHSAFKGRGMAFSEVREYQYGDDVRNIDWNVTARLNHPYVKIFEEEREMTVMLLVDVSGSNLFGTKGELKRDLIAEVAATLAFSAISNNDKVGVIFSPTRSRNSSRPRKAAPISCESSANSSPSSPRATAQTSTKPCATSPTSSRNAAQLSC